jgi:hypothetical protein
MRSRSTDSISAILSSDPNNAPSAQDHVVASTKVDTNITEASSTHSPGSPRRSYLSSFRRLASSSGVIHNIFPRKSFSTSSELSSEDSTSVTTPPDHSNADFARTVLHPSYDTVVVSSSDLESSPPSKKNAGLIRASSFADRLWRRGRTKSSAEIPVRSHANVLPPLFTISASDVPHHGNGPSTPATDVPHHENDPSTPATDASDLVDPPGRPTSCVSVGSTSSSSPLDRELFDAFPSVPQGTPTLSYNKKPTPGRPTLPFSLDNDDVPTPTQNRLHPLRPNKAIGRYATIHAGSKIAS